MPDVLTQHNIAALIDTRRLTAHAANTAGSTVTTTGITIDRMGMGTGSLARSAEFSVIYEATLQSGATLAFGYDIQHAPDGSTWTDLQTGTYSTVATGPSGGGAVVGEYNVAIDLNPAYRYVRFNFATSFSSTGTDTMYADGVGAFGGFDRLAAPTA